MSEDKKPELKIVHIGEKNKLSSSFSVEQMLENALKELKAPSCSPPIIPDKAMVVMLDTSNQGYCFRWFSANMTIPEQLSLLEVHKQSLINEMLGRN